MTLMGTWVDDDMSRKQFVKIVLPAGLTDPSEVQICITEDMEHLELKTALPEFLTESFSLHKHTFDIDYRLLTETQKKKNLRVSLYNSLLASMRTKEDDKIWYTSIIDLPEAAANAEFIDKRFL